MLQKRNLQTVDCGMGKYMRKSKMRGDVVATEVSTSVLGVLTRAKSLALQELRKSQAEPPPAYLELRSRKLEKSGTDPKKKPPKSQDETSSFLNPSRNEETNRKMKNSRGLKSWNYFESDEGERIEETVEEDDADSEFSFGENNNSEYEAATERNSRESTPCSVIRSSRSIGTPCSSSRRIRDSNRNGRSPTNNEIDEFFNLAEEEQQSIFAEKYNFDVVRDLPLPGRYDWIEIHP